MKHRGSPLLSQPCAKRRSRKCRPRSNAATSLTLVAAFVCVAYVLIRRLAFRRLPAAR
jgi:hypothetical protein